MPIPPKAAQTIAKRLEAEGHAVYLTGGAVRDLLLGIVPMDLDLATSALPTEVARLFPEALPHGARYGCMRLEQDGAVIDISTFRREFCYRDFRHPAHLEFTTSVEEDLARRDFTVNALALSADGRLLDPYGGARDLQLRRLRAVGDPSARLAEDPVRIVRALRLVARFGLAPDEPLMEALGTGAAWLERLASARRVQEVLRWLEASAPRASLVLADRLGLLPSLTGGSTASLPAQDVAGPFGWLAALYGDAPERCCAGLLALGFGPRQARRASYGARILAATDVIALRHQLAAIGESAAQLALSDLGAAAADAARLVRMEGVLERRRLPVGAQDLLQRAQKPPGPWLSAALERMHAAWLDDPTRTRDDLMRLFGCKEEHA